MAETTHPKPEVAETPTAGRPASSYGTAPHDPSKPPVKRQIVCFSFYKLMPEWRRLPAEEKAAHKAAFTAGCACRPGVTARCTVLPLTAAC